LITTAILRFLPNSGWKRTGRYSVWEENEPATAIKQQNASSRDRLYEKMDGKLEKHAS
jgi:hypothetical protein